MEHIYKNYIISGCFICMIILSACSRRIELIHSHDLTLATATDDKQYPVTNINPVANKAEIIISPSIPLLTSAQNDIIISAPAVSRQTEEPEAKTEITNSHAKKILSPVKKFKSEKQSANNSMRDEKLIAFGLIMAGTGFASAMIIGLGLGPAISSLAFIWMILAIAIAFWGIFMAVYGATGTATGKD